MDSRILNTRTLTALAVGALSLLASGCSNFPSRQPPIWTFPDMKVQDKVKFETSSPFFADGRGSRRPVLNTVSQEGYHADLPFSTGINADQTYVGRNPLTIDRALLERGQQKFNVYCAPCHDRTGSGKGVVAAKSGWVPGNLLDERIAAFVDGEFFHVITNGRRSMPGYRFQIPEKDRWAIVAYVRVLQRAHQGGLNDVPEEVKARLR